MSFLNMDPIYIFTSPTIMFQKDSTYNHFERTTPPMFCLNMDPIYTFTPPTIALISFQTDSAYINFEFWKDSHHF